MEWTFKEGIPIYTQKKTLSKEYINELFDSLGKLGMSREEIVDAVKQWSMED